MTTTQGNPISLGKAAKKYSISKMTLSNWAKDGRITVLQRPERHGQSLMVDEGSVILAREAYTPYWRKNEPRQIGMKIPQPTPPHPSTHPSDGNTAPSAALPSEEKGCTELVAAYLKHGVSAGWSTEYLTQCTRVLKWFGNACPVLPLEPEPLEAFISGLDVAQRSRHHYYKLLRAFYYWLNERYKIPFPLTRSMAPSKGKPTMRRTFSPEEVERIIAAIPDRETKTIVLLLRATAIRVGELCNLRRENVFMDHVTITGKTGERDVPIPPWIYNLLKMLGNGSVLFPDRSGKPIREDAVASRLRGAMLRAGLKGKKLGPHTLRHTGASELLEDSGGDLEYVRQILGHTDIGTTSIYAKHRKDVIQKKYQEQSRQRETPPEAQGLLGPKDRKKVETYQGADGVWYKKPPDNP